MFFEKELVIISLFHYFIILLYILYYFYSLFYYTIIYIIIILITCFSIKNLWSFPYFIILLYYYIYYNNTYYLFFEKELVIISLLHYFINRVSLNCEFSSLIFLQHSNSWTKHLEYFRSSFQKDGALVFQRSWNRCATTSCRKTCRPSCTWWTTRSTGGARPAPNTFCSWPVTWGFRWSRGTRITRDWREWVDANLPFPFLSRLWRRGRGKEKSVQL